MMLGLLMVPAMIAYHAMVMVLDTQGNASMAALSSVKV